MTTADKKIDEIDSFLAGWLGGEPGRLPSSASASFLTDVLRRIDFHGIAGLLSDNLPPAADLPQGLQAALRERAISSDFWEAQQARLLGNVLNRFVSAGLRPILLKGVALAYSHYRRPSSRSRGDADIIMGEEEYHPACEILEELGWKGVLIAGGDVLTSQRPFRISDPVGGEHEIDLHANFSNSAVLARLFTHQELLARSVPLERLSPHARRVGDVDALLIACANRAKHRSFGATERLINLQDLKYLTEALSSAEWELVGKLASQKGLTEICREGLKAAHLRLRIVDPPGFLDEASAARREKPARYLVKGQFGQLLMDFGATKGWVPKLKFLSQVAFPPREYMRLKFDDRGSSRAKLYLRRIIGGYRKRRRRPGP